MIRVAAGTLFFGITVAVLAMGWVGWPGLHHDSCLYTTPIIELANGGRDVFDCFAYQLGLRPTPDFNFHGQALQFLFGWVVSTPSYDALQRNLAILNALTYAVWTALLWKWLPSTKARPLIAVVVPLAILNWCVVLQGRPEQPVPLVLGIGHLVASARPEPIWRVSVYGVVIGVVTAMSPMTGYVLGCILFVTQVLERELRDVVRYASAMAAASLCTFALVLAPHEENVVDLVKNIVSAGSGTPASYDLLKPGIDRWPSPIWRIMLVAGIVHWLVIASRRPALSLVAAAVLLGPAITPMQAYNLWALLPWMVAFVALTVSAAETRSVKVQWLSRACIAAFALGWLANSAAALRHGALMGLYLADGTKREQTRAEIDRLKESLDEPRDRIAYYWLTSPSFVIFSTHDEYVLGISSPVHESTVSTNDWPQYERTSGDRVRFVLLPQLGEMSHPPEKFGNGKFELIKNGWRPERARLLGIKLGGPMPGYQYALYRRIGP